MDTIHAQHPSWSADDIWYFMTGFDYVDESSQLYLAILECTGENV